MPAECSAWPPRDLIDAYNKGSDGDGALDFARCMMDVHSRLYSLSRLCLDVIASQVPLGTNPSTLFSATSAPQVVAIPVVEAEPVLTSSAAKGVAAAQAVPASYLAASDYESSVLRIQILLACAPSRGSRVRYC